MYAVRKAASEPSTNTMVTLLPVQSQVRHNDLFYKTTSVSQHQKDKPIWIFNEARDDRVAVIAEPYANHCALLQTDNHASTSSLNFVCRSDALPDAKPTVSKH